MVPWWTGQTTPFDAAPRWRLAGAYRGDIVVPFYRAACRRCLQHADAARGVEGVTPPFAAGMGAARRTTYAVRRALTPWAWLGIWDITYQRVPHLAYLQRLIYTCLLGASTLQHLLSACTILDNSVLQTRLCHYHDLRLYRLFPPSSTPPHTTSHACTPAHFPSHMAFMHLWPSLVLCIQCVRSVLQICGLQCEFIFHHILCLPSLPMPVLLSFACLHCCKHPLL